MSATKPRQQIKERPILFSAPMIRAILNGSKSQTRRVVKPQPSYQEIQGTYGGKMLGFPKRGGGFWIYPNAKDHILSECPYGKIGDRLWCRETWRHQSYGGIRTEEGECGEIKVQYLADDDNRSVYAPNEYFMAEHKYRTFKWTKKPSIFMPRWASRITLEITGVRVERLQEISEEDVIAEGIAVAPAGEYGAAAFRSGWNSINGKRPGCDWQSNPFVWVLEFKKL